MAQSKFSCLWKLGIVFFNFALLDILIGHSILAQIVPDQTLGAESSVINSKAGVDGIQRDLIQEGARRGTNLFHSFEQFDVGEGQAVYFDNPDGIERIFSRITGYKPSEILGKLGVWNSIKEVLGEADLFLINPNGIIFGTNSSLNLKGSFIATTASGITFADGTSFSATEPSSPLLSISIPVGLQFRKAPGEIINQSIAIDPADTTIVGLQVQPNRTLALVGGNISLQGGSMKTLGGRIELGSVAKGEQVHLQAVDGGWALSYQGVNQFQDIKLTQKLQIINSQSLDIPSFVNIADSINRQGGVAQIQGRQIALTDGSQILGTGANVVITASETVDVFGISLSLGLGSKIANFAIFGNNQSSVTINTRNLIVKDGGVITTEATGANLNGKFINGTIPGGNLIVNASESVELQGSEGTKTGLLSSTASFGASGNIEINTKKLIVRDGAIISAESTGQDPFPMSQPLATGKGGTIDITASEFVEFNNSSLSTATQGMGSDAGNLRVITKKLIFRDGGQITSSTSGVGDGGTLDINAFEFIEIAGTEITETGKVSASSFLATTQGSGDGGSINIHTGRLDVRDEGIISVAASEGSKGAAGSLNIRASSVRLSNDGILSAETRAGEGNITLQAQDIILRNNSRITTDATGEASGGNIELQAGSLTLDDNSSLSAQANQGQGGNITLNLQDLLQLNNSQISTTSDGLGNGGNIFIDSQQVTLSNGASLTVNSQGTGDAGNIDLQANSLTLNERAVLSAETRQGQGGRITLNLRDLLQLNNDSQISTTSSGIGKGGNIFIDSEQVTLNDGARLTVNSEGSGDAGNIDLRANTLTLDDRSSLSAQTKQGRGGNIILTVQDILQLRNNSEISTTSSGRGDAGNIMIDTQFLIGSGNSDITANSGGGRGGAIDITATGVFGLSERDSQSPDSNDITAISQAGSELNGIVELNTPEIDPSRGLIELPEIVVDPTTLIAQNPCRQGTESELTVTGRGGLPPGIQEDLSDDATQVDLVEPVPTQNKPIEENKSSNLNSESIKPAQGWIFNEKGEVVLTAYNPSITEPQRQKDNSANCPVP